MPLASPLVKISAAHAGPPLPVEVGTHHAPTGVAELGSYGTDGVASVHAVFFRSSRYAACAVGQDRRPRLGPLSCDTRASPFSKRRDSRRRRRWDPRPVCWDTLPADYLETGFDLVAFFDCLHDMGDPAGAAAHVRQSLKPDGAWMVVEPMAGDRREDNLNLVGRLYYAGSTMVCVPTSLSQEVGAALGTQAGQARLREVIGAGGFQSVRRATQTPLNMLLEARLGTRAFRRLMGGIDPPAAASVTRQRKAPRRLPGTLGGGTGFNSISL